MEKYDEATGKAVNHSYLNFEYRVLKVKKTMMKMIIAK